MKTVPHAGKSPISEFSSTKDVISPATDLKGSVFTLTVLRINRAEIAQIEKELNDRISKGPRFFEYAPVVIDVDPLRASNLDIDLSALTNMLHRLKLIPVGVRHASLEQQRAAREIGLAIMKGGSVRDLPPQPNVTTVAASPSDIVSAPVPEVYESNSALNSASTTISEPYASKISEPTVELAKPPQTTAQTTAQTKVIHQSVRSGQQIYARDGDLIVLGGVNAGAEIVADGNIHIYGSLRGRALAGAQGDLHARIFCQYFEAELVAVAGQYRVFDDSIPEELRKQSVQAFLTNNQLCIERLR